MNHTVGLTFCALFLLAISASTMSGRSVQGTIACYCVAAMLAVVGAIWMVTQP